jgi:hypothetical protein
VYVATGQTSPPFVVNGREASYVARPSYFGQPKFASVPSFAAGRKSISSTAFWPTSPIHRLPLRGSNEKRHGLRRP